MTKLTMVNSAPTADATDARNAFRLVREAWGERAQLVSTDHGWEVVYRLGHGDTAHAAFLSAEMDSAAGLTFALADLHTLRGENAPISET